MFRYTALILLARRAPLRYRVMSRLARAERRYQPGYLQPRQAVEYYAGCWRCCRHTDTAADNSTANKERDMI